MVGDFNAKSEEWFASYTDKKGVIPSRCIYIRVGDILLPIFFVFGVHDKRRGQNVRDNSCSFGFTFMVCIGHVQNQNDGCVITKILC